MALDKSPRTSAAAAPTTASYKLTTGSITRYEYDDKGNGAFVKYRAGSENDTIDLTADEVSRLSPTFLKRLTPVPNRRSRAFTSTAPVLEHGVQQSGQYEPQGGQPGNPLVPLEEVAAPTAAVEAPPVDQPAPTAGTLDISTLKVTEVRELLNDIDDPAEVREVLEAEMASASPRSTIVDAATARLVKLTSNK